MSRLNLKTDLIVLGVALNFQMNSGRTWIEPTPPLNSN